MQNPVDEEELEIYKEIQKSPVLFIKMVWGLSPQALKPEYYAKWRAIENLTWKDWEDARSTVTADWFEPFIKNQNITWQQWLILVSIEKSLRGEASRKISVASGHGIGKSATMAWVILWFLFSFFDAQVPCTAPTSDQMYDVLWKELNLWIGRMPDLIKDKYEWQSSHIRMTESPETWFARAKTASKENTEALAGVHADHVLTIADESSGVPEQVFNTAEGAWTSGDILVILISNPTRTDGYFYDTHHKLKANWQTMSFSSIDSPIIDRKYEAQIAERHGRDSAEYGIRVLGKFPDAGAMDDAGYVNLLPERAIYEEPVRGDVIFPSSAILGVDPAGDGDDKTSWVIRDNFKAYKIHEESKSTAKSIAEKTITFITEYDLNPYNVIVDSFGVGADVGKEIAIASRGRMSVTTVNVGELSDSETEQELYLNKRAEFYWKMKMWIQSGGIIMENKNMKEEILSIKYKRNLKGKIQIMPKVDMKKRYGTRSPNDADAFSLTFMRDIPKQSQSEMDRAQRIIDEMDFDEFSVLPM